MNKANEIKEIPEVGVTKFFKRNVANHRVYLNFGSSQDAEFRAIAVGFIDLFLSQKLTLKFNKNYMELMGQYFRYFPQLFPQHLANSKPVEQLQHLVNQLTPAELASTLAYTLRQMTVDLLVKEPQLYQDVFLILNWQVTPAQMRTSQQKLPRQFIAATAQVLKVPIHVEYYPDAVSLPVKISYNYSVQHSYNGSEIYLKLTPDEVEIWHAA